MKDDMILLFNTFVDMSRRYHIPIRRKDMERMMLKFVDLYQELTDYVLPWADKIQGFLNGEDYQNRDAKHFSVSWKHHAFDVLDDYIKPKHGSPEFLNINDKNAVTICLKETWEDCLGTIPC